jgi:hypothetical protein
MQHLGPNAGSHLAAGVHAGEQVPLKRHQAGCVADHWSMMVDVVICLVGSAALGWHNAACPFAGFVIVSHESSCVQFCLW